MSIKALGMLGAGLSLSVIALFQWFLVSIGRKKAENNRTVSFMDLIITSDDESYSLSRLQMYLWTVAVIVGYLAVFFATPGIPVIPESLYILMGVNFASSVASTAINTKVASSPAAPTPPNFLNDIFFESPGSLDLPRTQMFIWTIVSLGVFIVTLVNSFDNGPKLPDITNGLAVLMGISNGAYLGAKAAK